MKRNTAKAVAFPAILLCLTALMSSCEELTDNQYQPEGKTNSVFETSSDTQTICSEQSEAESVENISCAQSDEQSSDTEPSYDEYVFAPPDEVKNFVWCSDYIQEKIEYEYYRNDETVFEHVPEEIADEFNRCFFEGDFISHYFSDKPSQNVSIVWIGLMNFDMNDDGIDDYLVHGWVANNLLAPDSKEPGDLCYCGVYMLFLANNNGSFKRIKYDAYTDWEVPEYILNTKTNGVYDLMVLTNGYNPKVAYDGFDSYSDIDYYDEKYLGGGFDKVSDDLVKITIKPRLVPTNDYYVAVKFVDNPFFKEAIAYTCLPDGSPRMYKESDEESIWDEGYIMYAELTENYDENELEEFLSRYLRQNILEMRFVEVV